MLSPKDFRNIKACWWPPDPSPQVHMERDEEAQKQGRRIQRKRRLSSGWDLFDGDEARDMGVYRRRI